MTDPSNLHADFGTLAPAGDRWTLTFTRRLPHPPEKVWRAMTEPEHRKAWFPDTMEGEMRAGAPLRFVHESGFSWDGEMLVFEPPAVMELRWGTDRLRFELEPDGAGTLLTLVDTFSEHGKAARDAAGWDVCLDRLVAELGEPVVQRPWAEINRDYVERFGPEAATMGPPA